MIRGPATLTMVPSATTAASVATPVARPASSAPRTLATPSCGTSDEATVTAGQQFRDIVDAHPDMPWRTLLKAWGELRAADLLTRDEYGNYVPKKA